MPFDKRGEDVDRAAEELAARLNQSDRVAGRIERGDVMIATLRPCCFEPMREVSFQS